MQIGLLQKQKIMKSYYTKLLIIFVGFVIWLFQIPSHIDAAYIPDIAGDVLVSGTNAPIPGVWVRLTSSGCSSDPSIHQSRYARTDSSGHYEFIGWTQGGSSAVGEGVSIDTDLNGSKDAIQYPTSDACDPSDPSPGSVFSCGRDPFEIEVIRPASWSGGFDVIGKIDSTGKSCAPGNGLQYCIDNSVPSQPVPTIYYHGKGGGGGGSTATPTASGPTATPTAISGSVRLNAIPSLAVGGSPVAIIPVVSGPVATVTFTLANTTVASVCASSGSCAPGQGVYVDTPGFSANLQGFATGTTTLTVTCTVVGGTCTGDTESVTTDGPGAWWQAQGSDIVTTGNILSAIPTSCAAPSCTNSLIIYPSGGAPGIASAGGSISTGNGQVSQSSPPFGWQANSSYSGNTYSYDYFENKAKCGVVRDLSASTINSLSDLTSLGAASPSGYYWIRYTGGSPLVIANDLSVGNAKIVLYVKNQDLQVKGDITTNPGGGFFMTIVGASPSGSPKSIIVDPAVSELHGIYFVDGQFRTGTTGTNSDVQLHIRGSVASMSKILLQRSLGNNSTKPAEIFEYSADQLLLFPACLGESSVQWKELAP
jgi:hypothetical protein